MKKALLATVAMAFIGSQTVLAADVVITTGSKTGSYFKIGHNLRGALDGVSSQVVTSKGSVENMDRIMRNEATIGIVQMDAYAWYTSKHPEAESKAEIMGPLYEECVYLAVNKNGKIQDEDDLQSKGSTIAIGKKGSGTAVTWDYMRQLEKGYKQSAVSYTGGIRALGKLASKPDGPINAVMWVTKPKLDGKLAQTVIKNENLKFLDVNDSDLNDRFPATGEPVYRFRSVELKKGFLNDQEVKTICTDAVLVADADADEDLLEQLSDTILNYKETILK